MAAEKTHKLFRAIKNYDGSDSDKCITLRIGDALSGVHTLDETWFIGHNDRTGETGAFPIECVEDSLIDENIQDIDITKKPDKPLMYANVSESIQKRKDSLDLSPTARSRTLSNQANKFDKERLVRTKPEIKYRLKFVKKDGFDSKDSESNANVSKDTNGEKGKQANIVPNDHAVGPPEIFSIKASDDSKASAGQRVRFSSVKVEHSISVPESTSSWQESSFEHSDNDESQTSETIKPTVEAKVSDANASDGKYHKFDKALQILKSGDDENKKLKAIFGAIAGLIIGALLYLVLVFSFDYTELAAGIIVAIATLIMSLCLAFSTLCRCVMALIFPIFFTGKGRTVFLSIIFGVLLSSPVANIIHNAKETGNSFSCMTELARNKTLALQLQLNEPIEGLYEYVAEQNRKLTILSQGISEAFSKGDEQINQGLNAAQGTVNTVIKQCKAPMQELYNICNNMCSVPFIGSDCRQKCQEFTSLGSKCDQLNALGADITKVANDVKAAFDEVAEYFIVDVEIHAELKGKSNTTKDVKRIQQEVNEDITRKAYAFEVFIAFVKKALSLSLALLFFQSFWYLRNYLAKDDYDNIYITSQFKELDKRSDKPVLPLKKKERSIYVDPSSFKLSAVELAYCKIGLAQILLHFVLCVLLLMFDFALYYILNLLHKTGNVDLQVEGQSHFGFEVTVNGTGPVALFYAVMIQGLNLHKNLTASMEIGKCLPNPKEPSVFIIPVLLILYIIALCFVLLRGYGMRLRRKIAAFYYPDQEVARLDYLHKKIRHKRISLIKLIRQLIKSSHKEAAVTEKLRLSAWLAFRVPILGRFLTSKERLVCTCCEHSERHFNTKLTKCRGSQNGIPCDAVYCEECWAAINHSCPLCTSGEEVVLRE